MFIKVADGESANAETIEIPVESDGGYVSLSTLQSQFPNVIGLKYRSVDTNVWRGVRVSDQKLYHPESAWQTDIVYVTVYPKAFVPAADYSDRLVDVKRKGDEVEIETSSTSNHNSIKNQRLDGLDNDPRRCVDLIVLGINYRSNEEDVRNCFRQYGELVFCEIKRDGSGNSRGFGFIRFKDYESQLNVLNKRHYIDGRACDVKIPDSKSPVHEPECARKIFVARLPDIISSDDLQRYFKSYGEVIDVYIPKPSRSFAFVTFKDSTVVPSLYGDHFINGCSVHVGPAEPKNKPNENQFKRSKQDHHSLQRSSLVHTQPHTSVAPHQYHSHHHHSPTPQGTNNDMLMNMINPALMQAFLSQFQAAQQQQQQQQQQAQKGYDWPTDPGSLAYARHKYASTENDTWQTTQRNLYR
ncbi:unnamed protein product [Didymodactylos carnosus]|uniref:RRM domain-containing protein n=1 Tax=Didymodactylos carnosus TaxID=1234261 RepID=A0A814QEN8_9BILA|nr:unnamed protein product [Didymodactylos carnosus]CAF1118628.1 unnamed protein product [Didymodactylos carnosus]CAF3497327.1 unnamed protein product [Didymodactylos carnosus]CAF3882337.1 unnamed protein product [Didymodactylos carnosus]